MSDDELRVTLAERPGWIVDPDTLIATYEPITGGWRAVVRRLRGSGRGHCRGHDRYDRWHLAVLDPMGRCHYAKPESQLSEARRQAEGQVNAKT